MAHTLSILNETTGEYEPIPCIAATSGSGGSGGGSGESYSSEEKVKVNNVYSENRTGGSGTWIDGKPIYRKVIT